MRSPTIALSLCLAAGGAAAQQTERFTLAGGEVAIYNLAGAVTVEPGPGPVAVQVTRGGAGAASLAIEQGELRGRETLRIRYPGDRVVYAGINRGSSTDLRVREDGTFGDGSADHDHGRHGRRHAEDGRRVRVAGAGEGLEAHADLRIQVPAGRAVAIYLAVGRVSVANVEGRLLIDAHSAPVTARATKGVLSVDVGSGPVTVSGAEGELSIDTGSGRVEVTGFRGTELSVDTGSGEVSATDVRAGGIAIETGSGNVTADLRDEIRSLTVETGSGDVAVTAPAALGAEVDIETASGDIETDFALQVTRHARDHLVGRIGDGKGRIAIETGSGDIRLLKRGS
ncbi:MAG TPA: DUF4097 family beta strand repeat-containing protein [Gemmatimonadales bacterium]|nr:DUF4097 family beta strand repeat-containing protein [Gemmatimonadales bacterium]